jgi:protein SCO1
MHVAELSPELSEARFAEIVDDLAGSRDTGGLLDLLREANPCYSQRGSAAIVRMRGWVLLAFCKTGLPEDGLPFLLEELDAGMDPYLVAAAARALRFYPARAPDFAPFVLRALKTMAGRDEPVSFAAFGEYAVADGGTSAVRELIETVAWLGPAARAILPEAAELAARPGAFSKAVLSQLHRALAAIENNNKNASECCPLPAGVRGAVAWLTGKKGDTTNIDVTFEDHAGQSVSFSEFFSGKPSIAVFFYTRCDNPLKCSLTITKLGRIQKLLEERGLGSRIRTAAITYDPAFDLPNRLRDYGERRGLRLGPDHRMLRSPEGLDALRRQFALGVNFLGSLVNRHRIEAYVLLANGQIAYSFERLRWDEEEVVNRVVESLQAPAPPALSFWGSVASLGVAFFPKCPVCWAAYLSVFGITGLERIPFSPWLEPALACLVLINLASAWISARSTGRFAGACLATTGALAIALSKPEWLQPAWGVALTAAGSLMTALQFRQARAARKAFSELSHR